MGNVKCTSFLSIKKHWPDIRPDAESQFMATLPSGLAQCYRDLDFEKTLSMEETVDLIRPMSRFLFPTLPETEQLWRLGELMAQLDLNGFYKFLLKFATIPYITQMVAVVWHTYHDQGEARVKHLGKNHMQISIENYPEMPMEYRYVLGGWIRGVMHLLQAKELSVTLLSETDPEIIFDVVWF